MKLSHYLLLIIFFFLPLFLFRFQQTQGEILNYPYGPIKIRATLEDQPKFVGQVQRFKIGQIQIVTHRYPEYTRGDRLEISGQIQQEGKLLFPKIKKISSLKPGRVLSLIGLIRQNFLETYQKVLPVPFDGLLAGIVLGLKESMTPELKKTLISTGTFHVVAASGMNVTIVTSFIMQTLFLGTKNRRLFLLGSLGVAFVYAALAGASPSVLRAAFMASVSYLALLSGRQNAPLLSLFWTVLMLLLITPKLLSDIGFQLSVASMFGLLTVQPLLGRLLTGKMTFLQGAGETLKKSFLTTVSAQIGTFPIIILTFGNYSLLSVLANTVSLFVIEWSLILGLFIGIIGQISWWLANIAALPAYGLLWFFIEVNSLIGQVEFGLINFEAKFSLVTKLVLIAGYYLILSGTIIYFKDRVQTPQPQKS